MKCNYLVLSFTNVGQIMGGKGGGELLPTKFKLFIDIKSSKWIIIKNNTQLTLTQPEMLATRMGESWTHYLCLDSKLELTIFFTSETHDFLY
jgi:hypothetical protein